jgi:hypothetical protein
MIVSLFIVGLFTALGCGLKLVGDLAPRWATALVWTLGRFGGAGLMVLAIALRRWGY